MEWTQATDNLVPQLNIRPSLVPLPMLLQSLRILAAPARDLQTLLGELAEGNPFLEVLPPAASVAFPGTGGGWPLLDDIPDEGSPDSDIANQLSFLPELTAVSKGRLEAIAGCLGPSGRLVCVPGELAELAGVSPMQEGSLLRAIQDWVDPPGLFARNLVECLLIQLRRNGEGKSDAWRLIAEAANLLEDGRMEEILERFGWRPQQLERAIARLRRLDPSPGFSPDSAPAVIPELKVQFSEAGVHVSLLEENLPKIVVMLSRFSEESHMRRMMEQARYLEIEYRRRLETKLAVGIVLAVIQKDFLSGSSDSPCSCVLADVAGVLSLHPATVHRTASRTWCVTPCGTVALGSLFSRPLRSRPDISVAQLRRAIRLAGENGMGTSFVAEQLGIPARTIRWHRSRMNKKTVRKTNTCSIPAHPGSHSPL